jgi:hypothetical protein
MVKGLQTGPVRLPTGSIPPLLVALILGGFPAFLLLTLALLPPFLSQTIQITGQGLALGSETLLQLSQSGARGVLSRKRGNHLVR